MWMANETRGYQTRNERLGGRRRLAGTTLVELLVVIVIFLIGILAVVQVFPKGLQILNFTGRQSNALTMARETMEKLKSEPAALPDMILPLRYEGLNAIVDPRLNPLSLAVPGSGISATGMSLDPSGTVAPDWQRLSGPNAARRILGETSRIPSPRQVGGLFGSLLVLQHGPIDSQFGPVVYANDLTRSVGEPREAQLQESIVVTTCTPDGATNIDSFSTNLISTVQATSPTEYFVVNSGTPGATLFLPTAQTERIYRLQLSAFVMAGVGSARVDFQGLAFRVPAVADPSARPLVGISINQVLRSANAIAGGESITSVELDTVRIAPLYRVVTAFAPGDPYQVMVMSRSVGSLLFPAVAASTSINRSGGANEPLVARVDYDVYDWRIIGEDLRYTGDADNTYQLTLQALKVGTELGADGRANGPLLPIESATSNTDNVVLIDLITGGVVVEDGRVLVNKSRGTIAFQGSTVDIDVPNGATVVRLSNVLRLNRTFRVLYRAKNEYAVQVVKPASQYAILTSYPSAAGLGAGQCSYGLNTRRLYFATADVNRKVTIDQIHYVRADGTEMTIEGQDFRIHPANDGTGAPYIDLGDADAFADRFSTANGSPVRGVKGASVVVRVMWNPERFSLTGNVADNLVRAERYQRGWRQATVESFARPEVQQ